MVQSEISHFRGKGTFLIGDWNARIGQKCVQLETDSEEFDQSTWKGDTTERLSVDVVHNNFGLELLQISYL